MKRTPIRRKTPLRASRPVSKRPPSKPRHRRLPDPSPEFWREQREALYARAAGRCERAGCSLDDNGMEAHHRKLRSRGGGHGLENLAALCPACHRWCHEHPQAATEAGFIVPSVADPGARAVVLHDGRTVRLTVDGAYDVLWDVDTREAS